MLRERVLVKGLLFQVFPTLEGQAFQDGKSFLIDGEPLPDEWTQSDWKRANVGSRIEFVCHVSWRLSGVVSEVSLETWVGKRPFLRVMEGEFEGDPDELEKSSLGSYGDFQVITYHSALVEPYWLLPKGIELPWKVYQSILLHMGDWRPFRPLTLSELWQCVKYASDSYLPWSRDNLKEALSEEGNFAIPTEIRDIHNALRLASALKEDGWPVDVEGEKPDGEQEILNLWFDLDSRKWLWLKPDSLVSENIGLSCCHFTRKELEQDDIHSIAIKLLFPVLGPFFSLCGQVFESTSGPA